MSFFDNMTESDQEFFSASIYKTMVTAGFPGIKGLSEDDGLQFVRYFIRRNPEFVLENFHFTTSYTADLLLQARSFSEAGRYEFANVFYATWIEHTLNSLIARSLRRNARSDDEIRSFIKTNTLKKKVSSAWISVFGESAALPQSLIDRILEVADTRNEFVHYKWDVSDLRDEIHPHQDAKRSMSVAEEIVEDLEKRLEDQLSTQSPYSDRGDSDR